MKKYFYNYVCDDGILYEIVTENGKRRLDFSENYKDKELYLKKVQSMKEEIKLFIKEQTLISELEKIPDALKKLIEDTFSRLEDITIGDNQEFVLYQDDNYFAYSSKGNLEEYELATERLTIISKDYHSFYFITIEEESEEDYDDYYTYSSVTIFKKENEHYIRRDYRIPEISTQISEDYKIDELLEKNHIHTKNIGGSK